MKLYFLLMVLFLYSPLTISKDIDLDFSANLKKCINRHGNEISVPAGPDFGNLSSSKLIQGDATPESAPGATTVTADVAFCLTESLKGKMYIFDTTENTGGIKGAYPYVRPYYYNKNIRPEMIDFFLKGSYDTPILVYCYNANCHSSWNMVSSFSLMGYKNVIWMRDGIKVWVEKGYPTENIGFRSYNESNGLYKARLSKKNDYCDMSKTSKAILNYFKHYMVRKSDYVKVITENSCVRSDDSDEVKNAKISYFWHYLEQRNLLSQSTPTPEISNKHILKAAVYLLDLNLLRNAIQWKLNLNYIDTDDRTLLDYVKSKVSESISSDERRSYNDIYNLLKGAGAKHRVDMPSN